MPDNRRDYDKELEAIMNGLADSVVVESAEELPSDLRAEGLNPDTYAEETRQMMLDAIKAHKQEILTTKTRGNKMKTKIDFEALIPKFDKILKRGLRKGGGLKAGDIGCVENAVCEAIGLPYSDDPKCVAASVRTYKIGLNDAAWSSNEARASGLRDLGIAQIGSKGVVDDVAFAEGLSKLIIRHFIPALFRDVFRDEPKCLEAADRCAAAVPAATPSAASDAASYAASAARSARYAASDAASAARYAASDAACYAASYAASAASDAASAARYAARAACDAACDAASDKYLLLSASLALQVLRELKSPGCEWIDQSLCRGNQKNSRGG